MDKDVFQKNELDADPQFQEHEIDFQKDQEDSKSLEELPGTLDETFVKTEPTNISVDTNIGLDMQIEQMIEKKDGLWQCKVCGKTAKLKGNLKNHSETHVEGFSHSCHVCNKSASTRISLKVHMSKYH